MVSLYKFRKNMDKRNISVPHFLCLVSKTKGHFRHMYLFMFLTVRQNKYQADLPQKTSINVG